MQSCLEDQSRCRPETNALLKCATIEAQIACETGSGQPRIVGCGPRELAQQECLACDRFCERWTELPCPPGRPGREECVATCLDPRCRIQHSRVVDCMSSTTFVCDEVSGRRRASNNACENHLFAAAQCTASYGQPEPFHWLPVELEDAATGG